MKTKIEVGQCYEQDDKVYEIIRKADAPGFWVARDTLSKEVVLIHSKVLLTWRRPFQNFG